MWEQKIMIDKVRKDVLTPKHAEMAGAMSKPAKIAPTPEPSFQPQVTPLVPTVAIPTPMRDDTRAYVEETVMLFMLQNMTQVPAPKVKCQRTRDSITGRVKTNRKLRRRMQAVGRRHCPGKLQER
jgi:hypothetical protein